MDLKERIEAFVAHVTAIIKRNYEGSVLTPPVITADYISAKWCRITRSEINGTGRSVYCFICLQAGETKALGKLTVGDIHKSATWKAPAKHARGSVFSADFDNCAGPYGVVYLR